MEAGKGPGAFEIGRLAFWRDCSAPWNEFLKLRRLTIRLSDRAPARAPSLRQHPKTGERTLDRLWWGLIPHWCKDADGGRKPINAKAETVASLPTFRDAYKRRRCLIPIDSFFEWRAIHDAFSLV